jgi:hypothetical protein
VTRVDPTKIQFNRKSYAPRHWKTIRDQLSDVCTKYQLLSCSLTGGGVPFVIVTGTIPFSLNSKDYSIGISILLRNNFPVGPPLVKSAADPQREFPIIEVL